MASENQIRANRANAAKSTGPTTPEGKRRSSRNAVKHGLLIDSILLDGECPRRFAALLAALDDFFHPQTCVENHLIETMAVARWRQMRLWGMERAHMAYEIKKQNAPAANPDANNVGHNGNNGDRSNDVLSQNAPTRASIAVRTLADNSRVLDMFQRHEARLDRQFNRALDRLQKILEKRNIPEQSQNLFDLDISHLDITDPHVQS